MKITAVIAEYNPFHNGHLYQLRQIREESGADFILVVMSGDFMQRGIPAIINKYDRCRMALENGADLVFELPVYFALGSAQYFAMGAVSLINKLGVADSLHFGSECGDIDALTACAMELAEENAAYKETINSALKEGRSFPNARASALESAAILSSPNNILGAEYIKALLLQDSSITPVTIRRNDSGYHSLALENGTFASANALRELLKTVWNNDIRRLSELREFVPDSVYQYICSAVDRYSQFGLGNPFVFADDFSQLLRYKLLSEFHNSPNQLAGYYDVSHQLANTFHNNINRFSKVSDFILDCKSKNLTYTRISRCLMHILLNMKQETIYALKASDYCQYARLLGFNRQGKSVLKHIKANASIPIITKPSRALKELEGIALDSLKADIHASAIYQSVRSVYTPIPNELTREVIRV